MFLKITKQFGKPICVVLYAVFAAMAAKKKPLPLKRRPPRMLSPRPNPNPPKSPSPKRWLPQQRKPSWRA